MTKQSTVKPQRIIVGLPFDDTSYFLGGSVRIIRPCINGVPKIIYYCVELLPSGTFIAQLMPDKQEVFSLGCFKNRQDAFSTCLAAVGLIIGGLGHLVEKA